MIRWLCITGLLLLFWGCTSSPEPPEVLSPEASLLLARAERAMEADQLRLADNLVRQAATQAPEHPDVLFLQARILTRMAQWAQADSLYLLLSRRYPDYPGLWHNLGNNAARAGRFQDALRYYREALRRHPSPLSWRSMGRVYLELDRLDSAEVALRHALDMDSTYVEAWLDLAERYEREGRLPEALQAARMAYRYGEEQPLVRYRLGNLLLQAGNAREALPLLESVVEEVPWHHAAHYALGRAYRQLGRSEEAETHLRRAETLRALQAKAEQMELMARNTPRDPYVYAGLASVLRQMGRYADARRAYEVALFLDPDNVEFMNNLALTYVMEGESERAVLHFRQLLQQHPEFVDGWVNLGILYARQGDLDAARHAWQQALHRDPEREDVRRYLAGLPQAR